MIRTIAILAMPGVQLLDVAGPMDVFAEANAQANAQTSAAVYRSCIVAIQPGAIVCSSGARLMPDHVIGRDDDSAIDTLLVAGSPHATAVTFAPAVTTWLRCAAKKARRYGSVCSGAFPLAATGLLDDARITTHWAVAPALAAAYPQIAVDADAIHVRDGKVRTAAGVTAGLDLALALVEEDLGADIARRVASQLVMFFQRPGGQMQFSRKGQAAPSGRSALQEVQRWIAAHPGKDHSVPALARRMDVSPRHFARLFRAEVGMTPAAWVDAARVDAARRLLEDGRTPKQVAARCGFANADVLRRAFARAVGVTPAQYRRQHTAHGG